MHTCRHPDSHGKKVCQVQFGVGFASRNSDPHKVQMQFCAGDIILKSTPFGAALDSEFLEKACSCCLTCKSRLRRCTGCSTVSYCSDKCQESDAVDHKLECEALSRSRPWIADAEIRLLCRIWCRLRRERAHHSTESVLGTTRSFESLMTHREQRDPEYIERIEREIGAQVNRFLLKPDQPSREMLVTIFLKMDINTHQVTSWDGPMGCALYLGGSILDHSCAPDRRITYFFDGSNFVMKALEDVEIHGPHELFIGYVSFILPRELRRKQLRERYFFDCRCPRCLGQEVVTNLSGEEMARQVEAIRETADCGTKYSRLSRMSELEAVRKLPPNDYVQLSLNAGLFAVCGTLGRYEEAALIGYRILEAYDRMEVAPVHTLYLLCQVFSAALNADWYRPQNEHSSEFTALLLLADQRSQKIWGSSHHHSRLLRNMRNALIR